MLKQLLSAVAFLYFEASIICITFCKIYRVFFGSAIFPAETESVAMRVIMANCLVHSLYKISGLHFSNS